MGIVGCIVMTAILKGAMFGATIGLGILAGLGFLLSKHFQMLAMTREGN